jgi:hypothetical protein
VSETEQSRNEQALAMLMMALHVQDQSPLQHLQPAKSCARL